MNCINVSKKAFNDLERLQIPSGVLNEESDIFNYTYHGKDMVIKRLKRTGGEYYATKLYTVEMLDALRDYLPHNFVLPEYLVSTSGSTVGFALPKIEGITLGYLLKDKNVEIQEKLDYLKSVGMLLKQLEGTRRYTPAKDIFINDFHDGNFIVNPKNREVYAIDLDSCKVGSNKVFLSRYLNPFGLLNEVENKYKINPVQEIDSNQILSYEDFYLMNDFPEGYIIPDENTDIYCYIMMLLEYLFGTSISSSNLVEFVEYLNVLNEAGVNQELIDTIFKIVTVAQNENPVYYLDSVNEKNIVKTRQIMSTIRKKGI